MSEEKGFGRILHTLSSRNYRLYFTGQAFAMTGYWMQKIAMGFLVYQLTGSATALGIIDLANQLPTFILGPVAGVILERWDLRRVLMICQTLFSIQALVLAILTFTGHANFETLFAMSVIMGLINAFELPTRQSFVIHLVEKKEDLSGAIALNSVIFNMSRLFGPTLAGFAIDAIGSWPCFMLNSGTYMVVLYAMVIMRMGPARITNRVNTSILGGLKEGLQYAWEVKPIRNLLLMMAAISFLGFPYVPILPALISENLSSSAKMLGMMLGATGIGAMTSSLYLAGRPSIKGLEKFVAFGPVLFGTSLILIASIKNPYIILPATAMAGLGMNMSSISVNTYLQSLLDERKRTRVMGLFVMIQTGLMPMGSYVGGRLADNFGTSFTYKFWGISLIIAGIAFIIYLPKFLAQAKEEMYRKTLDV